MNLHKFSSKYFYPYFVVYFLIIGLFFRVYGLFWDAPYFFHPDERNVASLVTNNYEESSYKILYTGTYSYGNFIPLYLTGLLSIGKPLLNQINNDTFVQAIILLRINTIIFSILLLYLILLFGNLLSRAIGRIALVFATFNIGLIQHSHFGTVDIFATFWIFLTFYLLIVLIRKLDLTYLYFSILSLAIACSAKLNSMIFIVITGIVFLYYAKQKKEKKSYLIATALLGISTLITATLILSPYYASVDFANLFRYEREMVTGVIQVFYSGSFVGTIPVLFQFTSIYPFLLNLILAIVLPFSLVHACFEFFKKKNAVVLLTLLGFLILFIPSSFLYAKWSRYLLPTIPFAIILISHFIIHVSKDKCWPKICLAFASLVFALIYITTVFYARTPIDAAKWAKQHMPSDARILTESYDIGITTFNSTFSKIELFDFYDLENNPTKQSELDSLIKKTDYVVLPSQRVYKTRLSHPQEYPKGYKFYNTLFFNHEKYKKIYETPCNFACKLLYAGDPISNVEETINIFDRPQVVIFKVLK